MLAHKLVSEYDERLGAIFAEFERSVVALIDEIPEAREGFGGTNIYGEQQKRLDVLANELFIRCFESSGAVAEVATEELGQPLKLGEEGFAVVMDPLDGSSNIASNNLMGTIVGIYRKLAFPLKPEDQLCAFYTLYGPATTMVFATPKGVHEFVLARKGENRNRFLVARENLRLKEKGEVYGVGGLRTKWPPQVRTLVEELEAQGYKLRYGGSLVGDFNQVLHYGGLFAYPATTDSPSGKLRALYEAGPIAYIAHAAGGYASDGTRPILAKQIAKHDEKTPLYVGSTSVAKRIEEIFRGG